MYQLTFAYLVSPAHLHCILGTFLFFLFSIFYFLFLSRIKNTKTQLANKLLFSPKMFLSAFFFFFVCLFAFLCFSVVASLRFCAFWCFLVLFVLLILLVRSKSFGNKNEGFKTALITTFILLLLSNFLI